MDDFKKETVKGYTKYDINASCVNSKNRAKDAHMIKRTARRKNKSLLKAIVASFDYDPFQERVIKPLFDEMKKDLEKVKKELTNE